MNIVNFSITEPLAKKINRAINEWGFTSKAEFFRYLAFDFIVRNEFDEITENKKKAYKQKI